LSILNSEITYYFYHNICRSLFDKHKKLFAFLIATKCEYVSKAFDSHVWNFILYDHLIVNDTKSINNPEYIPSRQWNSLTRLSQVNVYSGELLETFKINNAEWQRFINHPTPENEKIPHSKQPTPIIKFLLLLIFRYDRIVQAMNQYIAGALEPRLTEVKITQFRDAYLDSTATNPIIFILSPGADPMT
jgi:dynein heavy chain